ncbi:MAG TPA: SH3 domain-containing protein, partial [Chloroflexota bacterium]|nr:SH3 domain-containing protein [Chloroflexota bacterium]
MPMWLSRWRPDGGMHRPPGRAFLAPSNRKMRRRPRVTPAVALTALLALCAADPGIPALAVAHAPTPSVTRAGASAPHSMWSRAWETRVRAAPNGRILTELDLDQEVEVTGRQTTVGGVTWLQVTLWGALTGWTAADLLALAPVAGPGYGSAAPIPTPAGPHLPMPLRATARVSAAAELYVTPSAAGAVAAALRPGAALTVTAWATDRTGEAWYAVRTGSEAGWVSASSADLLPAAGPRASLAPLRGTGMWLTPAVLNIAPPEALVDAARKDGVTHLYVEVATSASSSRFIGGAILDKLLPVAHRAHISVIA